MMKTRWIAAIAAAAAAAAIAAPARAQGMDAAKADALLKKAACQACHSIDKKGVGPAFKEVAKKYKGDAAATELLVKKVRAGGAGVWGPIPMPPHAADKIADDDLRSLVGWLLAQ